MNSLERINPDTLAIDETTGDQTLKLHLERYRYAGIHLVPGNVCDIACGVGYGSFLMADEFGEKIQRVIAVDNDAGSIQFARTRFSHPKINFVAVDATQFECEFKLHNVVSLETIEHLSNPEEFIYRLSRQLERRGRFIASVPVTPSMDANPYHLHDFTESGFKKLLTSAGMKELTSFIQIQKYNPVTLLSRNEKRSTDLRKNIAAYYLERPSKFFLRLKSLMKDGFSNKYLVTVFEKE